MQDPTQDPSQQPFQPPIEQSPQQPIQSSPPESGYAPPLQGGYAPSPMNQSPAGVPASNNKMTAGLLGIFLGGFGVHKFVLGYTTEGAIMLAASILTCGFGYPIVHIVGLVEGIMYLTKTDEEFIQTYVNNRKPWF